MENLNCKYCNKICKNDNSLRNHERLCKQNPNRMVVSIAGIKAMQKYIKENGIWNKGLTKETNNSIAKGVQTFKARIKSGEIIPSFKNRHHSEESKLKISKNGGGIRVGSGRGHGGWYKDYYCYSTYELAYIVYNLDHNIDFKRCPTSIYYTYSYKGKEHKYYPDFLLPDNSLVEIKGYHSEVVDLKTAAVKDRAISVLYKKDILHMIEYVKSKYKIKHLEELYTKK